MDYQDNIVYRLSMYFPIVVLVVSIHYFYSVMRILFE